jgi:hypothetical protein
VRERRFPKIDAIFFEAGTDPLRPEKNLLLAVLERAIKDVLRIKSGVYAWDSEWVFRDAIRWFRLDERFWTDQSAPEWSYQWVCQQLGHDPRVMHDILRRAVMLKDIDLKITIRHRVENSSFRESVPAGKVRTAG